MTDTLGLTSVEAARELRISVNTLLRWAKAGRVPYIKLGGRKMLFSRRELEALVRGQSNPPTGSAGAG